MLVSEELMEFFNKPIREINEKFSAHIEKLCKENPNGKIYYTAPEQVYDKRTDSWSWHYYAGVLPEEVPEEYLVKSILKKQTMIIDLSKNENSPIVNYDHERANNIIESFKGKSVLVNIKEDEKDLNYLIQCCVRVGSFFANDPLKAELWLNSARDDFGMSPVEACLTGNGMKMLKFIEARLAGNNP